MTTRIDAAYRTDASVKRLRLPLTRIGRKQQGLKQTTDRFVLATLSLRSHRLTALWMWHSASSQTSDVCCVKFLHRSFCTAGAYFLAGYFCTLNLYKPTFSDLPFLRCNLYFADCLTEDNNSVPDCLSPVVMDSQRKTGK